MRQANKIKGKMGKYLSDYYAGYENKRPIFDSSCWTFQDVFDQKFSEIQYLVTPARTNNPCESLNSAFKHGAPELPKPNDSPAKCLYKIIEFIKFRLIFTAGEYDRMPSYNRHKMYMGYSTVLRFY